jgi:hypothetical protein
MVNIVNGHDLDTQSGRADFRAAGGWVEGNSSGGGYSFEGGGSSGTGGGTQTPTQGATFNTGGGGTGGTPTGTPSAATGDLAAQYAAAIQKAQAALAAGNREAFQRAIYEWDTTFGFDKEKFAEDTRRFNEQFAVTQAGLTGMYQGAATLPALTSYATQFGQWGQPTAGQSTLAAQQQAYAQQMGLITQAAALQANPFRQQQVIGQMSGLLGGGGVASFQAPNTVAGVGVAGGNTQGGLGYLQQMIQDIRDPTANTATMNEVMKGIPTPNKLNSTEFLRAAPSTQSMVLQGMQEKWGLDPNDALAQIKATLPQFQAPTTVGAIKR